MFVDARGEWLTKEIAFLEKMLPPKKLRGLLEEDYVGRPNICNSKYLTSHNSFLNRFVIAKYILVRRLYNVNFEEEARFQRLLGKSVIRTEVCWWVRLYSKNFYLSWPSDISYPIKPSMIADLLLKNPFSGFCLANNVGMGCETYFWYADSPYDLSTLKKKARNQTRRGLEKCKIAKLDWNYLAEEGVRINKSSVLRQKETSIIPFSLIKTSGLPTVCAVAGSTI